MSKQIEFNSDARAKLKAGVDALANAFTVSVYLCAWLHMRSQAFSTLFVFSSNPRGWYGVPTPDGARFACLPPPAPRPPPPRLSGFLGSPVKS